MRKTDTQLGTPEVLYKDTKTNIEALTNIAQGALAYATDTDRIGIYNGTSWNWSAVDSGSPGTIVYGLTDVSKSDATWEDMPDMSITLTTGVGTVEITFNAGVGNNTSGAVARYRLMIDDDEVPETILKIRVTTATVGSLATIHWLADVAAGEHTFKIQWYAESGTIYNRVAGGNESRVMIVREYSTSVNTTNEDLVDGVYAIHGESITVGVDRSATSGSSYTFWEAIINVLVDFIDVSEVIWDLKAGTYTLTIDTIGYGDQSPGVDTDDVTWTISPAIRLGKGEHRVRLTRSGSAVWFYQASDFLGPYWSSTDSLTNSGANVSISPMKLTFIPYTATTAIIGRKGLVYSAANVSNPPTDAELDALFGSPASVEAGWMRLLDDNGEGIHVYLIGSDGSNWWRLEMSKVGGSPSEVPKKFVGCKLRTITTPTTIPGTGVITDVTLNSEIYDTDGFHSESDGSKIVIPTGFDGYYSITAHGSWSAFTAAGDHQIFIYKNTGGISGGAILGYQAPAGESVEHSISVVEHLAAGDYVKLRAAQDSGNDESIFGTLDIALLGT